MKKTNKFTAAAVSFALAVVSAGCSAPGAVTIGNNTKNAATIEGYDVPAGVFIAYELASYENAASQYYSSTNTMPTPKDVKKYHIEGTDASTWIQNQATEQCRQFVAIEKEYEKIGGSLTDEEQDQINESYKSFDEDTRKFYEENGISEESIKKIVAFSIKRNYIFEHYYGIDGPNGCSEDDLKNYFVENNARVKYIEIKTADGEGNAYDKDTIHELEKKADDYVKQINAEKDNADKMAKMDELRTDYEEYAATITTAALDESGNPITTTTTAAATTTSGDATTTTTTTDPYANERIVAKITTTTASPNTQATTTEPVEKTDSQKASEAFNNKIFAGDMVSYTAEKYQYDDNTIYVVIKGDLEDRMNSDDLWSDDIKDQLIYQRYYQNFTDWIDEVAKSYTVDKNKSAYKRYEPFNKLKLEMD